MKIKHTFELSKDDRYFINKKLGLSGPATREDCLEYILTCVEEGLETK